MERWMGRLEAPDPKGWTEFWSKLWSEPVENNRDSELLKNKLRDTLKQENFIITIYWFKKVASLNPKLKQHLQEWVNAGQVPTWMTEVCTVFIMKNKSKGTVVSMVWIDYQKVYDIVSHSWILECARTVGKLEDSVDSKPGGTWDSRYQNRNLLRRLIITFTLCDHHDTTVTDSKGHKSWLSTRECRVGARSIFYYLWNCTESIVIR